MPTTRKPPNPELAQAARDFSAAVQHVRNAVRGKIEQVQGVAAAEIAKAKAALLKKTNVAQDRVERVLKSTETRLHKAIVGAQKALDKAVAQAEKQSRAGAPRALKAAGKKAAAKKAKAAPARKAGRARKS